MENENLRGEILRRIEEERKAHADRLVVGAHLVMLAVLFLLAFLA